MLFTGFINGRMLKTVIIADCRKFIAAWNAYHIESNDFFYTVRMEIKCRSSIPCIIACKNAVSGRYKASVSISGIKHDSSYPVNGFISNPASAAVRKIFGLKRLSPADLIAGSHTNPAFSAVDRFEETVAPAYVFILPGIFIP